MTYVVNSLNINIRENTNIFYIHICFIVNMTLLILYTMVIAPSTYGQSFQTIVSYVQTLGLRI